MARTPRDVTEAELQVLQVLWREGPCPARRVAECLYGDASASRVASAQTLLGRLEQKGFVARDKGVMPQTYAAAVGRDDLIGRRLRAVAEQLCEGSLTPLLTHLVSTERLSERDRAALRKLIDDIRD